MRREFDSLLPLRESKGGKNKMNILFVCRYNRFRSKIAEAYFKKISKNRRIKVKSAGIFIGSYPLDRIQVNLAKKFGIIIKGKPQGLSTDLLKWEDIIVNVANDVPNSLFQDNVKIYKKKSISGTSPQFTYSFNFLLFLFLTCISHVNNTVTFNI